MIAWLWQRNRERILVLAGIAALMLVVQIINVASGSALIGYGVMPRKLSGLVGIVCAPFLHLDWEHLSLNLIGLGILDWLASLHSVRRFLQVSAIIILLGGLLLWLAGRPNSVHVGASGWVFGLWAWLLANAIFHRNLKDFLLAIAVLFLYSGLWAGLLPQSGVSFEGHISGVVAGAFCSWWEWRKGSRRKR